MNEELAYRTIAYLIGCYKNNDETTINQEEIDAINFILNENQQLKEQLNKKYENVGTLTSEILYEENTKLVQENQQLKKQYCERTDCSGRIGNSKKVEELEKRLEASERARKEAIEFIKEYEKNQNLLKWNEEDYIDVINEIKKYLDIDKGE